MAQHAEAYHKVMQALGYNEYGMSQISLRAFAYFLNAVSLIVYAFADMSSSAGR
jgi:hypothetical protein